MEFFVGQICLFPWSWTPHGWLPCDGRSLSIADYQILFSLIGTEFGGDGRTAFNLPNLTPIKGKGAGDVGYFICVDGIYPQRD